MSSNINTMQAAPSIISTAGTLATYARKLAQASGRPDMEIILDNHAEGKIYTTFDPLSGKVEITAPHNVRFDEIQITLEGSVKTWVENLSPHTTRSKVSAYHNFLKMTMPIEESRYPQPRIAEVGRTYIFPFNFVIPEQLLPKACAHGCVADHVHLAHLQLPPSMGDREVTAKDDLTPDMAKVVYAIKVKVVRNREQDGKDIVLKEGQRKLHIVPAQVEEPPMNISGDSDYALSKTKALRKGMFSGKLGKITVSAAQPNAIILSSPSSLNGPATTMATVNLRFDPHEASSKPPKLGGLVAKMKAVTFYGTRPNQKIPSKTDMITNYETMRGIYDTSLPLSSRCVESVTWEKHTPSPAYTRRSSTSSSSSSECSDDNCTPSKAGKFYYTASILVPITLPSTKTWVPTFHSCIVSRVYTIDLFLTIHTPGTGVPASTVSLHLPVQIAANGSLSRRGTLTEEEAAMELAAADEYLRPRVIEAPREELVGNSRLVGGVELPPSYEDFAPARAVVDPGQC